jgi:hypothetical protein
VQAEVDGGLNEIYIDTPTFNETANEIKKEK